MNTKQMIYTRSRDYQNDLSNLNENNYFKQQRNNKSGLENLSNN